VLEAADKVAYNFGSILKFYEFQRGSPTQGLCGRTQPAFGCDLITIE